MAKCEFHYPFSGSAETLVSRIDGVIKGAQGSFEGDGSIGFFSVPTPLGTIEGSYRIDSQTMHIAVTRKPVFLPCNAIQQKLEEYIRRA